MTLGWSAVAEGQETFGLAPPVRITKAHHYRDGGTVGFELEDSSGHTLQGAFDNHEYVHHIPADQSKIITIDMPPRHCYAGGLSRDAHGARSLTLNGQEEREIVRLLHLALSDTLPAPLREQVARVRVADDLPAGIDGRMWHLVKMVARRLRTFDGIDRGLLLGEEDVLANEGMMPPVRIEEVERVATDHLVARIRDTTGKLVIIGFPPSAEMPSLWGLAEGRFRWANPRGSVFDRSCTSLALIALRADTPLPASSLVPALRDVLAERRQRILDADSKH